MPWVTVAFAAVAGCTLTGCPNNTAADAAADAMDVLRFRDGAPPDVSMPMQDVVTPDAVDDVADVFDAGDTGIDVPTITTMHARVANVISPNPITSMLPPTIDVCARPAGASGMSFTGPLLAASGLVAGAAWNQVSAYLELPAGSYDLLFVAAPASDCNHPVLPIAPALDLSSPGAFYTVLLAGIPLPPEAGTIPGAFRAAVFTDHDPAEAATAPQPLLRLFDALPSTMRFDVGIVMDPSMPAASFVPIFGNIGFGEEGQPFAGFESMFDALDYYEAAPFPMLTVGARVAGTGAPPVLMIGGLSVQNDTFTTAMLTQAVRSGSVQTAALLCIDNAPGPPGLSACQVVFP